MQPTSVAENARRDFGSSCQKSEKAAGRSPEEVRRSVSAERSASPFPYRSAPPVEAELLQP
jgi:hypothetical protein